MKTLAFIFSYNRAETLRACLESVLWRKTWKPDETFVIDDGSNDQMPIAFASCGGAFWIQKKTNLGFSDSAQFAFNLIREKQPEYVLFIEGDYVFRPRGLELVMHVFQKTDVGRHALGIVGYDHPNFRNANYTDRIFPECMKAQVGEDNVNRTVLHRPEVRSDWSEPYAIELVSNTCFSCYLNWAKVREVAAEFPELYDLLAQAAAPRDNPNYPDSGKYRRQRTVDDGMLSHAISLCWNRWAIKHGIDRSKYAAWLNIRPSVAEHRFQGGTNF